jgi:hypothetical protein
MESLDMDHEEACRRSVIQFRPCLTGGILRISADFDHFRPKSGFFKNRFSRKRIEFSILMHVFPWQLFSDGLKYRVGIKVLVFHWNHF